MFGYFNRNYEEILDIPIGPSNRIEPGPPDQGQPTHFLPRRQTGVFAAVVPADFGDQRLTWTLTAHGEVISIPGPPPAGMGDHRTGGDWYDLSEEEYAAELEARRKASTDDN